MKQIFTLDDLIHARLEKKAVLCSTRVFGIRPTPAAFMANLSGEILHRLMKSGMYIYEKPNKQKEFACLMK